MSGERARARYMLVKCLALIYETFWSIYAGLPVMYSSNGFGGVWQVLLWLGVECSAYGVLMHLVDFAGFRLYRAEESGADDFRQM